MRERLEGTPGVVEWGDRRGQNQDWKKISSINKGNGGVERVLMKVVWVTVFLGKTETIGLRCN